MGFLLFHVLFIYVVRLFYQNKKYMKRVVLFAMVLMLGVVSVQAQWFGSSGSGYDSDEGGSNG